MLDYLILQQIMKKKENFEEKYVEVKTAKLANNNANIFQIILLLIFASISAYLSWEANTLIKWPLIFKVIFSIFAFLFGALYIFIYLIFKLDMINYIKNKK